MVAYDADKSLAGHADSLALLADAARALDSATGRVHSAAADLFVPADIRLTDHYRTLMAQILRGLVSAIEDDCRHRLVQALGDDAPTELRASLGAARIDIAMPILERAMILRDPDLIAALLRRVDEHRLSEALVRDMPTGHDDLIGRLFDKGDSEIARAAMALMIAESRRSDHFGDPALARTDLPPELERRLLWWIAAALRDYMTRQHGLDPLRADLLIAGVASGILAEAEPGSTLEERAETLVDLLAEHDLLTDLLLADALMEGRLALLAAGLAHRAALPPAAVWTMITDPAGASLAVLLRAIGCARDTAVAMLWRLGSARGMAADSMAARVEHFDGLAPSDARQVVQIWRLDSEYRRTIARIADVSGWRR